MTPRLISQVPNQMPSAQRPGPVVAGLCAHTHDSAAALIVGGELVGFAEEERLTGTKHTKAFPGRSLDWLLREAGITAQHVTHVGYNFDGRHFLGALPQLPGHLMRTATRGRAVPRAVSFARLTRLHARRRKDLASRFPGATVTGVLHHRAHGLYAFASSGYEEAAVLVVDSLGEIQTTTIAHASRASGGQCRYRIVDALVDPASLGYAYGAITEHLGWRRGDEEGTVMALAALGDPSRFRSLLARAIPITDRGFTLDVDLFALRVISDRSGRLTSGFVDATCPPRHPADRVEQVHADLAAALQERTEQVMLRLAQRAARLTSGRLLVLAGGVAANCLAAGRISTSGKFDEVHVPPAPGDSGTALGAAVATHLAFTGALPSGITDRCYLGPSYTDGAPSAPSRHGLAAHSLTYPARFLADRLAQGQVIGVFRGRLEAGPRALGNRSILASPLMPDVVQRLNHAVKFREPFRPFAPVVLADKASDYFQLPQPTPYMSFAYSATELARARIPAIVHANGTARVQTVTAGQHPFLAQVLAEFEAITGVPVLINTSLNVKGKPICGTPDMALNCLQSSGLDALLLEDRWVTKR
jgi:carbamoyltransferase